MLDTEGASGSEVYDQIKVLELATGIAGPYATMFLADNGADVVKVESRAGDPYRSDPGFQTINRNKRSIVIDDVMESDDGQALIRVADVIIVDHPGQGPILRALNPRAVIVTMPPWGERGPLVDAPTSRTILHAATGIAWSQQSYGEVPVDIVVPVASYGAGVLGALAASTGLLVRAQRGVAPTYEVSGVAGAAAIQLGEFSLAGPPEIRPGDSGLGSKGRVACYRLVEAQDGKWFFLACGTSRFYERMLDVIGRPELINDPQLANPPWGLMLDEAIERITPILDTVFATKSRAEWLQIMAEADVPAQPVLTREEFLQTSIVAANEMDVAIEHPELGPVNMMGLAFTIESAPGSIRAHAPLLGRHGPEVLDQWLEPSDKVSGSTPASGGPAAVDSNPDPTAAERPLAGVTVIDLASFIAGPVVSRHLAMLGADVIKVEPPAGDPFRGIGPPFISWNQGKRSIAVDLTTDEGRQTLHQLVVDADIVVENFRPGVATRLGADRETLSAINPDLVFLSSPGYGIDETRADQPAFDPLIQSLGGFMAAQGGLVDESDDREPGGTEPVFLSVPIHDVVTPMVGALGLVMALWQRHHQGGGQHVRTSLAHSTMVAQAAEYTRFAGRPPTAIGGFDYPGPDEDNTWSMVDDEPVWTDGELETPVCRVGLTSSELAQANDLVTTDTDPVFGPLVIYGQLIGGAGGPPSWSPQLDEHGPEIRAELERRESQL